MIGTLEDPNTRLPVDDEEGEAEGEADGEPIRLVDEERTEEDKWLEDVGRILIGALEEPKIPPVVMFEGRAVYPAAST